MELKDYLIVYGKDTLRGGPCYKETEISCDDLIKYMDIIKTIILHKDDQINWMWGVDLIPNNDPTIPYAYIEHYRLFELYPDLPKRKLLDFQYFLPGGITKIESIKIFRGEKVKII